MAAAAPALPRVRSRRGAYRLRSALWRGFKALALAVSLALVLIPFLWLVTTTFKTQLEYLANPPVFIPSTWTLNAYRETIERHQIGQFFLNSVVIALASTALSVFFGATAAYSLARARFPWRLSTIIAFWMLVTRMYPAIATAIPYFIILRTLGLLDTQLALIITYTSFNLPFVIWLMLGFYEELPIELERAAMVDGASVWQRFSQVVVPVSTPALVATAILSFILAWNEFLFAVILTTSKAKTLPVVISGFITDKGMIWDQLTALGVITVLPVLVFALLIQRYLVRGLTLGAVKE